MLNIPLQLPETEQGPGMGGAMLAMVTCGAYATVQDACDAIVRTASTVEPDVVLAAKYEDRYQKFRKIYPALKEVFPALA